MVFANAFCSLLSFDHKWCSFFFKIFFYSLFALLRKFEHKLPLARAIPCRRISSSAPRDISLLLTFDLSAFTDFMWRCWMKRSCSSWRTSSSQQPTSKLNKFQFMVFLDLGSLNLRLSSLSSGSETSHEKEMVWFRVKSNATTAISLTWNLSLTVMCPFRYNSLHWESPASSVETWSSEIVSNQVWSWWSWTSW